MYRVSKPVASSGVKCADQFFPVTRAGFGKDVLHMLLCRTEGRVRCDDHGGGRHGQAGNRATTGIPFYVRSTRLSAATR
jgi:hypothetical protein